jgi:hypothetical protein
VWNRETLVEHRPQPVDRPALRLGLGLQTTLVSGSLLA